MRYHLSNGKPKRCVAAPGNCRLGGFHSDSLEEAQSQAEKAAETEDQLLQEVKSGKIEAAYRAKMKADDKLTQTARNLSPVYNTYRFALLKATTREPNANFDEPDEGVAALPEKQRVELEKLREDYVSLERERDAARKEVDEARTALQEEYAKALKQLPEDYVVDASGLHVAYCRAEKELELILRVKGTHERQLHSLESSPDEKLAQKREHYRNLLQEDDAVLSEKLERFNLLKLQQAAYMKAVDDGRAESN